MAEPQQIPQIATELAEMSRDYLRQEVVEPAKNLGKHAGMGVGGAMAMAIGAFFLAWAAYNGLKMLFPQSDWYDVLSRFLTALGCVVAAGLIGWRMSK
ncbi:MAG: phage holin family protein [Acidimicrobiia bacterium]|nr:phage holin family protein [Acidimicrobiia bacterium]